MFNNTVDDLPSVNGHSELAAIPKRANASRDCGPVMLNITYINHMGYPITVVTRQGFRHVVPVSDVPTKETSFRVRIEIAVTSAGFQALKVFMAGLPEGKYKIMHDMKAVWDNQIKIRHMHGAMAYVSFVVDYVIEPKAFFDNMSVYHRDSDCVISRLDIMAAPPHPYHADAAVLDRRAFDPESNSSANACIQFELIEDPEHPMTPRYVCISNRAFKITPKRDIRREPGLYVTSLSRDPENHTRTRAVQEVYDFDQMEKELGIFQTAEEALSAGDLKSIRQSQLAELEHQTTLMRRELEGQKATTDRLRLEREEDLRRIEHERRQEVLAAETALNRQIAENKLIAEAAEHLKLELKTNMERLEAERSQRTALFKENMTIRELLRKDHYENMSLARKDVYDDKSSQRKDYSELLKFLPAAVIGIGALVTAVSKYRSA